MITHHPFGDLTAAEVAQLVAEHERRHPDRAWAWIDRAPIVIRPKRSHTP